MEIQRIECRCGIHFVPTLSNNGLPVVRQDVAVKDVVDPIANALDGIGLSRGCGPETEVQHNLETVSMQRDTEILFPLEVSIIRFKDGIILLVRLELDG